MEALPALLTQLAPTKQVYPPIDFFYRHFHNSIRDELSVLAGWVSSLDVCAESEINNKLLDLKARYKFLEQVYKYHSHVEDEVRALGGVLMP